MSTVIEQPKATGELANLCRFLSDKDQVAVHLLPKNISGQVTLAQGLAQGFIQIGRRNYSRTITATHVVYEPGTKRPKLDEYLRPVVEREYATHLDNDWSWTDLRGAGRKHIRELLAEDAADASEDLPRLHVRLTTAGLAACA